MAASLGSGRRARTARLSFAIIVVVAAGGSLVAAPGLRGVLGAGLALTMGAIALYDARHFIIPNSLNAAALALGLAYAGIEADVMAPSFVASAIALALVRGLVAGGLFLAVKLGYQRWRGRTGLGMGDVKLAAVAGVWLDWIAIVVAVELAAAAAIGAYLLRHRLRGRPMRASNALPFGLYFAPAIWVAWLIETVLDTTLLFGP
jgi:leader peptidase (prepilin peptidase)/N-methyltransferase